MPDFLRLQRDVLPIGPETVFMIGDFPVTNSFLMIVLLMVIIVLTGFFVKRFALIPSTFQNTLEWFYESILSLIDQITGERSHSEKIFPVIGALFFYVGLSNVIGFIPGLTSIEWGGVSIFRIATTDFNVTFGLAFAMLLVIQVISIREWGILGYISRFIRIKPIIEGFKKSLGDGFTAIIEFFIGLLDIISEIAKVVSLSLRLFGNMYAGEVLAVIILGAFAFVLPATWMALNLLFAVVQTLVFGLLVAAYYMLSLKTPEE